jgi:glycosyltransferase involved in cell wall biosynthesis
MNQISVVMGAYNEEATISESIESILSQTYSYWELIIIDDCSTDRTAAVIKRYCDKDHRISIHKNSQNLGLAESLNKGISLAKGPYIARMDADDLSLPNRFEEQVKILDSDPWVMVVGSAAYYINRSNTKKKLVRMPEYHRDILRLIFKMSPFIHPSVMMRREFVSLTNGYNPKLRRAQDYDLWLRGRFIGEYYNIQVPLILYSYQNNKMFKGFINTVQIRLKNASTMMDIFKSVYWSIYEAVFISLVFLIKIFSRKKGND